MACWFAVASAAHVRRGRAGGFMQVCHGKGGPLSRVRPGDWVAYYSPSEEMGRADGLKSFTAIGRVREGAPYQVAMSADFHPFRRDVDWIAAEDAPIQPLLDTLALTRGKRNWGYVFRFGLVAVSLEDMAALARAMRAENIPAF